MKFLTDFKVRQWLYGIAAAALVLLTGLGFIAAEQQEQILQLVAAILDVGIIGGMAALAISNAKPSDNDDQVESRGKYGDYEDNE